MPTTISLELPEEVVQNAEEAAKQRQTRLETIFSRWISQGMVEQGVSSLINSSALLPVDSQLSAEQQTELRELLWRNQTELMSSEYLRLDELLRIYRQNLVREAQAVTDWLAAGAWNTAEVHVDQLHRLDSSMLYAVGYDPKTQTMEVVFNSGGIYRYSDVPPEVYEGLLHTESKGRYMWLNVLNLYPYERLRLDRE